MRPLQVSRIGAEMLACQALNSRLALRAALLISLAFAS